MKYIVCCIFPWCFSFCLDAQSFISIEGQVYDSLNDQPVGSVHVYLENNAVGTVSSYDGFFNVKIPVEMQHQYLHFSCMGYKRLSLPIDTFTGKSLRVYLEPDALVLNEVVVREKYDSGRMILRKAINAIEENYPSGSHFIEAFYREVSVRDSTYTRLLEASVLIKEQGYDKMSFDPQNLNITGSRIKIQEVRKSNDFRSYIKYTPLFGEITELQRVLQDNYMRFLNIPSGHFLSNIADVAPDKVDIALKGTTSYDEMTVFIITLTTLNNTFFIRNVDFYINKEDFAFIKIDHTVLMNIEDEDLTYSAIEGKYFFTAEVSYRKIGERYVPFLIQSKKYPMNIYPYVKSSDNISLQYVITTLLLTGYWEKVPKNKWSKAEFLNNEFNKKQWPYNEEFWKNYNVIKLNPVNPEIRSYLEKDKGLEEQFQDEAGNK